MRITTLIPPNQFAHPTGAAIVAFEYANRLAARGHEPVLAWIRPTPETLERMTLAIRTDGLPLPATEPRVEWFRMDDRVRSVWVDWSERLALPEADIFFNAPIGHDERQGMRVPFIHGLGVVPRDMEDAAFLAPGYKICVSRYLCDELVRRGAREQDLAHIPNGVDLEVFRETRPAAERARRVAMLHHYLPVKGTDVGLAALESIKARMPDVEAVLFGTLQRPADLPAWVDYHRLPSRLELARLYNSASVFLCPSRGDSFYLCAIEAMACGCALASTDFAGVHEYGVHDENALLSPSENPRELAENAVRLLEDVQLRARIARAGWQAVRRFGWEARTDHLEQTLRRWLQERRR